MGDSKQERDFEKLVIWASSFSIAVLGGCLASLKQVNPSIVMRFSVETVVGFIGGGVLTALFLRIVLHGDKRRRSVLVFAAAIVSVIGYFLFAIGNTARETRNDFIIGTVAALTVLSFLAWVIYRVGKFFESDQPEEKDDFER
jgi:hypothetical protein